MTTEEVVKLAEKHGARVARAPEPFPNAVVMEPAQLAALIDHVRRETAEGCARICGSVYIDGDDPDPLDCIDAIRAKFLTEEEGK